MNRVMTSSNLGLKVVEPLSSGLFKCLTCNIELTEEAMEAHANSPCFAEIRHYITPSPLIATKVELSKRLPCWECSRQLLYVPKKKVYLAWDVTIDGFERHLHRWCAERLGYKCAPEKEKVK